MVHLQSKVNTFTIKHLVKVELFYSVVHWMMNTYSIDIMQKNAPMKSTTIEKYNQKDSVDRDPLIEQPN